MKHLLKRDGWSGTALILGVPMNVEWTGAALVLREVSEDMAGAILAALAGDLGAYPTQPVNYPAAMESAAPAPAQMAQTVPAAEGGKAETAKTYERHTPGNAMNLPVTEQIPAEKVAEAHKAADAAGAAAKAASEAKLAEKETATKTEKATKADKPKVRVVEKTVEKDAEPQPEAEKPVDKPADKPAAPAADASEIPAAIKEAARFKDVVVALQDAGMHTENDLVAEIERIKPHVPILSKVADVRDRVQRTLQALGGTVVNG